MSSVNKEEVLALYKSGLSIPEVSAKTGRPQSSIRFHLKKAEVLRSRADGVRAAAAKGKLSHMLGKTRIFSDVWKENIRAVKIKEGEKTARGFSLKPNGYYEITRGPNKGKGLHTAIMEKRIGRPLQPDECVHHIDGNKLNNEENNLALLTRSGHSRLHRFEEALAGKLRERKDNGRYS